MPRPIRILIAEDEPCDRLLLERALSKSDFDISVHSVSNGREAIDYLKRISRSRNATGMRPAHPLPTLLLLDLKMPRATGFEILRWIRSQPKLKLLPVIVLSGSELQDDIRQAYADGANSYLVKPLGFQDLIGLVKNISVVWIAANVRASVLPGGGD